MSAFLTPTLENLTPYTPGDIPRKRSILKLNTNEIPYPPQVGGQAVLGRQGRESTPWLTKRHG